MRPRAMIATSGRFRSGEPNLPPIAPMLLSVMVPPSISAALSLLCDAISCNLANSFVIWCNYGQGDKKFRGRKHETAMYTGQSSILSLDKRDIIYRTEPQNHHGFKGKKKFLLTSNIDSDCTFFMFGTTKPCVVAIAIPML